MGSPPPKFRRQPWSRGVHRHIEREREREREREHHAEGEPIGERERCRVYCEPAVAIVTLTATCHHRWSQPPSSPFMPSPFLATAEPSSGCAPPRRAVSSWRRGWWLPLLSV
ncbi:uncharacterized protein DS421_4g130760 [Arachis hypogaea]|nr:uncharacterized protein DS421_4g130760 [Arachis hypogaea]